MLRLIVYLVAFLKLMVLGRWTPPGHVYDVSSQEFAELVKTVNELSVILDETAHLAEATRQKVYRDGKKTSDESVPAHTGNPANNILAQLRSGDSLPADWLQRLG